MRGTGAEMHALIGHMACLVWRCALHLHGEGPPTLPSVLWSSL